MFTGKEALILFWGIFWAAVLATMGKYRLFDTHLFFSRDKNRKCYAIRRSTVGFIIVDVFPILWFWGLYSHIIPEGSGAVPVMAAAFASLSVFGFNRILHSMVASEKFHSRFYSQEEWEEVIKQWGRDHCNNEFKAHFLPGIFFLAASPLLVYIVKLIADC